MQSPTPVAKKISGRSECSGDSNSEASFDFVKSVTDIEDMKVAVDDLSSNLSATTLTEKRRRIFPRSTVVLELSNVFLYRKVVQVKTTIQVEVKAAISVAKLALIPIVQEALIYTIRQTLIL